MLFFPWIAHHDLLVVVRVGLSMETLAVVLVEPAVASTSVYPLEYSVSRVVRKGEIGKAAGAQMHLVSGLSWKNEWEMVSQQVSL